MVACNIHGNNRNVRSNLRYNMYITFVTNTMQRLHLGYLNLNKIF